MFKKEPDILSGPIASGLLAISVPIMIMNVVQTLFNIVDMTILKMFDTDGGYAVGAVGSSSTLISLITGLLIGIASGATVVIAKRIGSGDKERVERAVGTSLVVSGIGGLSLLVVGVLGAETFLGWMNCPEKLLSQAVLYFRLYFVGVPILMIYNFCAAILRAAGDSRRPMIYLTLGGALKVVMNFVFVGLCDMTVVGVALATILSWLLSAVLGVRALLKYDGVIKINLKRLRIYREELSQILYIGVPAGMQQALYSVANTIIAATVNIFGPDATTGISIANNFDGILYQISVAPSLALVSYVSQNIGNGNVKRAEQSVGRCILITVAFGASFGALSAIFSSQLSSIMSDIPEVIAFSRQKMIIISSTYFICGINEAMGAALRGIGKPIVPMISTMVYMCAFRFVWVYLIFPVCPNLTFLYLVWPVGWILSIATNLIFYVKDIKKLRRASATAGEKVWWAR